jgi:hypothetical protein
MIPIRKQFRPVMIPLRKQFRICVMIHVSLKPHEIAILNSVGRP